MNLPRLLGSCCPCYKAASKNRHIYIQKITCVTTQICSYNLGPIISGSLMDAPALMDTGGHLLTLKLGGADSVCSVPATKPKGWLMLQPIVVFVVATVSCRCLAPMQQLVAIADLATIFIIQKINGTPDALRQITQRKIIHVWYGFPWFPTHSVIKGFSS